MHKTLTWSYFLTQDPTYLMVDLGHELVHWLGNWSLVICPFAYVFVVRQLSYRQGSHRTGFPEKVFDFKYGSIGIYKYRSPPQKKKKKKKKNATNSENMFREILICDLKQVMEVWRSNISWYILCHPKFKNEWMSRDRLPQCVQGPVTI